MNKKLPCSSTKKFFYGGWDNYLRAFNTNIGKGYHKKKKKKDITKTLHSTKN